MRISAWSAFTFSLRNAIRPVTLGFIALQAVSLLVAVATALIRSTSGESGAAWFLPDREGLSVILNVAFGLLIVPFFISLTSRLSADVFGRPIPVPWWRASLRSLKATTAMAVAGAFCLLLGLSLQFLLSLTENPPRILHVLSIMIPVVLVFWLFLNHACYPYGVLFEGRFSFRQAREYMRGRRARLLGGWLLLVLVLSPIDAAMRYEPLMPRSLQPYATILGMSAVSGLMIAAFLVLTLHFFFEAVDEAKSRSPETPEIEPAPLALEG